MKQISIYETNDGQQFPTEAEARAHYAERPEAALVGLISEDIEDALAGKAPDIADALEKLGARLARERVARGERKRARKGGEAAPGEAPVQGDPPFGDADGDNGGD